MKQRPILTCVFAFGLVASACSSPSDLTVERAELDELTSSTRNEVLSEQPETLAIVDTVPESTTPPTTETTIPPTTDTVPETTVPETTIPPTTDTVNTCESPELVAHYVDVALDDPDGGLNVRSQAGPEGDLLTTLERGKELISVGNCEVVGSTDWWEVTASDGSFTGWAASSFLSNSPVFNPGVGAFVNDAANVGLETETAEQLVELIADNYGFDADRVITFIDGGGIDSIGAEGTWDITGAKDDSINGYRVSIGYDFLKDENAENILGVTSVRVSQAPLCSRGVTDDGLCV